MHRAAAHSVGRLLIWRSKGCLLEYIHWRSHCAVSLSGTLYLPLSIDSTHEDQSWCDWKMVDWDIKSQTEQKWCTNLFTGIEYIYVSPCKWNLKAVQALENLLKSLIYRIREWYFEHFSFFAHCDTVFWYNSVTIIMYHRQNCWWYQKEDIKELGLPRLRNFVNVYTNSRNWNDSVYT